MSTIDQTPLEGCRKHIKYAEVSINSWWAGSSMQAVLDQLSFPAPGKRPITYVW